MVGQTQLRAIGAEAIDLASEIQAALALLAEDPDGEGCFVLTRAGIVPARANPRDPTTFHLCSGDEATRTEDLCTPRWDPQARILYLGQQIVKRYKRLSPNQELVLATFEEEGWPIHIYDPLPPKDEVVVKKRLRDTIEWLNLSQVDRLLRLRGDGTGDGQCYSQLVRDDPRKIVSDCLRHG